MSRPAWWTRVAAMAQRAQELEQSLASPDVIRDRAAFQQQSKELSDLAPLLQLFREYQRVAQQLADAEALVQGKIIDADMAALVREEMMELTAQRAVLAAAIEQRLLGGGAGSSAPVILEIRAGTGGLEAGLFAADLLRAYTKYASRCGLRVEPIDHHATEAGGYKEAIVSIAGPGAFIRRL